MHSAYHRCMKRLAVLISAALLIFFSGGVSGYFIGHDRALDTRVISAGAIASMTNAERSARGIPTLSADSHLRGYAQNWAETMASDGNLRHSNVSSVNDGRYTVVGENVGYGPDAETIHNAFMASSSHRSNILDRDYDVLGVGSATDASGRLWVAVVFGGLPAAPVQAPESAPAPKSEPVVTDAPKPKSDPAPRPSEEC